jgi:predicted NAD-dependent protein-ADP-ribosyltransferase YbiA (DUF1768 family)
MLPSEVPYDSTTATQIKSFYKLQRKKPSQYKVDEDGTLRIYSKSGELESSLTTKAYRTMTPEERSTMEHIRLTKLAGLDVLYEAERRVLIAAYNEYKRTGNIRPVVLANQKVREVEMQRVQTRSPLMSVKQIANPTTNQVLFDEPYETRKLFGQHNLLGQNDIISEGIFVLERRSFPPSLFYGRYQDALETPEESALSSASTNTDGATVRLATGVMARLFFDTEEQVNGWLSPLWPTDFIYKETQYASAFQAYEASRMEEQGNMDVRAKILKTRSARTIGIQTRKFQTPAKNPQALWMAVLSSIYQQHPEMTAKLQTTGQDSLVYADPNAGGGGVGVPANSKKILDPTNWQSENIVGKVLESIRASSREMGSKEMAPPPEAKESVITEEQLAAKKAAIIRARTGKSL